MSQPSDTDPKIERMLIEKLRQMPGWRKMELVEDLNRTVRLVALSGLRRRHPAATETEIRRRFAELLVGKEICDRAYGPMAEADDE